MASYQRAHLLARSLVCYENQDFPKDEFEVICIDDSSTDGTKELVQEWSNRTGIKAAVISPYPKTEAWRDCGAVLNIGIRASTGKHVLLTHPEVMCGKKSVAACVKVLEEDHYSWVLRDARSLGVYACCRIYYMGPRDQERIDTVDWKGKGAIAVREIEGFYDQDTNGNPDYMHRATDIVAQPGSRMPVWGSWVFGGHSRETWKRLGGMCVSQRWGAVDVSWAARRRTLGIPNYTCPDEDAICVHQNHDLPGNIQTPRDMNAWVDELKNVDLQTPSKLVWPAIDELGWGG
jgi:GT2 family glycosyltransferase